MLEDRWLLSFTPVGPFDAGASDLSFGVVTADLNNDSHLDLAMPNYWDSTVSVLLGDGQGGFGTATLFDVGNYPRSIAVGDFNEDGKLDLTTANQGDYTYTPNGLPSVSVLWGNGDGTFLPVMSLPTTYGNPHSIAVGDFNADGHLDLGVGSASYSLGYYHAASVHEGDGAGDFAAPKTTWPRIGSDYFIDGIFESAIAADINGDGADDLVLGDTRAWGAYVFLGGDASGFLQLSKILNTGAMVEAVAVGDLNGDGALDIVTANANGEVYISVFLGDGLGGYGAAQGYSSDVAADSVVLGDFTGDGYIDIATNGGGLRILRGNGDGTFSAPERLLWPGSADAAGDFNEDGWLDLVWRNYDTVPVLLNDSDWGQLPGDYNASGVVDTADYVIWRKTLGDSIALHRGADGSGNGVVDGDDYNVWRAHFGQTLPPAISVSDATVAEGNTGTANATFTLTLAQASAVDVTVHYDTAGISAVAGSDYTAGSGIVTIPAGQISRTFAVAVLGDRLAEVSETFAVYLSAPTNAMIGDGQGIGTILDDEPRISINDVSKSEGRANKTTLFTFTVTFSAAHDQPVTMSYRTANGSATTSDGDYIGKTGTLTFAPGETTKTITIEVKGDNKTETDETFYLDLFGNSSNSLFTKLRGIGTIWNDD